MKKYLIFLVVGLPSFLLAVPINYILVDRLELQMSLAYAIVLLIQVSVNFLLCRVYVFENTSTSSFQRQYLMFLVGIASFRFVDWLLYTILVASTEIYYLYVQLANVLVLSLVKFLYSKRIFEPSRS